MSNYIEQLSWKQAREFIKKSNPKLTEIIDDWNPSSDYQLMKVKYQFGDRILKDGSLYIPTDTQQLFPLNSPKTPEFMRQELSYCSTPLGVITAGSNEVFLETENKVLPLAYFQPGIILGLWETLDPSTSFFPKRIWEVSAGVRSMFLLPSISQRVPHEKLRRQYSIKSRVPTRLIDQQKIFTEVAKSRSFNDKWSNEIIFFGKRWIQRDEKNISWLRFHHHLLETAWKLSAYNRNKVTFDRIWLLFHKHLIARGMKVDFQLLNIVKHIVAIGVGGAPGFRSVASLDDYGPVKSLQQAYLKIYGLKKYIPTMMVPGFFDPYTPDQPVYYSLQLQTQLDATLNVKNFLSETRELKLLLELFTEIALEGLLKIENTPVEQLINYVDFEFFHNEVKRGDAIENSRHMPIKDKSLIDVAGAKRGRKFSESSIFTNGCVRLIHSKPR